MSTEPGDTYGYQIADGELYTYLDEYRTYGSLNGGAPAWYACDENGTVTGVVIEIPVTWISDDYDKDTPGTYTFTAQVSDYSYTGELPYALVTVVDGEATVFPSISGVVWLDENSDGIRDLDETGVEGYPVVLYAADDLNTVVQETVTEADGAYRFEGMAPGSYVVSVTSEIIGETEYLLPLFIANDNRFEMDEEATASWSAPLELAEDTAVSGMDAGMRLPMGVQLFDGAVIQVSNFDDLKDVVWPALSDGDTILLTNDIEFTSALNVTKNVTIKAAPEAGSATLTSTGWRHFVVSGNKTLTLDHVVLDGGGTAGGIDLETGSSLTLQGVRVQDCLAPDDYGGGIYAKGSNTVLIEGSEISGCSASYGGGISIRNNGYLTVTGDSKISVNTVTNSNGNGGGIYGLDATITIEDSEITSNTALYGGGMYSARCTISAENSEFSGNEAAYGGGLYSINDTISAKNSEVSGNEAQSSGGGIYFSGGAATFQDSRINGNKAGSDSGGVRILSGASFVMSGGEISYNESVVNGGGVYVLHANSSFRMADDGTISNNTAQVNGGGIYLNGGTATLLDSKINGNKAGSNGGGVTILGGASLVMNGGEISGNEATENGGGVQAVNASSFSMTGGTISNNTAQVNGGGVYLSDSTGTIVGSELSDNKANGTGNNGRGGGGIYADGGTSIVTIEDSTVLRNEGKYGGGIYVYKSSTLIMESGSEVSDNTAMYSGGGIYADSNNTVTIYGGKIINNTLNSSVSYGGGIATYRSALTVVGGEVSGNTANNGGGIHSNGGSLIVEGGEVSGNTANNGGGIYAGSDATIVTVEGGGKVSGNTANYGGGIYNNRSFVTVADGEVSDNTAMYSGGGIYASYNGNSVTVTGGGKVSGNTAKGGGGIYANSSSVVTVAGGEVTGNTAANFNGGGICASNSSVVTVEGGKVSDNTVNSNGGGIYADSTAIVTVEGGEVTGNTANNGGGIYTSIITKLSVSDAVTFSGNTASVAGEPLPDMTANYPQIATATSSIYNHPLNNYDIFVRIVTVHYVDTNRNPVGELSSIGYAAVYGAAFTLPHEKIPAIPGYVYAGWQWGTSGTRQGSEVPVTLSDVTNNTDIYLRYTRNSVTVSNVVSGDYADKTRDFTFTLRFEDSSGTPLTGTLTYKGGIVSGSGAVRPSNGTLTLDANGDAIFTLRHGQQITIADVPTDGKVWIETESVIGYTASWSDSDLSTGTGVSTGELTMTGTDRTIAFTNTYADVVATGIRPNSTGPALLLSLLAGVAVLLLTAGLMRRRRQKGVMN
ncbi:right-handed parallel beta-helix repeat-containing protein [Lacrimispora amygdalina]|uniref:right-handed parallel beta-helix repeat-containing protein n=1 Tax=Lacrimispora amygdalina TaxID=253257 RepID=UPI00196A6442|nr:right-handed parallel beta-helix repeat-containing protein [Clostridium indicum]